MNILKLTTQIELLFENDKDISSEIRLWRNVILQAIYDAKIVSKRREKRIIKMQAISWLKLQDSNFHLVCRMANVDTNLLISYISKEL